MKPNTEVREVSLIVEGLPPAKDGANSIFNAEHGHHPRVVDLLQEAQQALADSHWNPTERGRIGLELVMAETSSGIPGDAINYLGGVADVLQANRRGADLSHLGDLAKRRFTMTISRFQKSGTLSSGATLAVTVCVFGCCELKGARVSSWIDREGWPDRYTTISPNSRSLALLDSGLHRDNRLDSCGMSLASHKPHDVQQNHRTGDNP